MLSVPIIQEDCEGCIRKTHIAQQTFEENWTLFQINLPRVENVNITYDVMGNLRQNVNSNFKAFVALDDIEVKPGLCPTYGMDCFHYFPYCRVISLKKNYLSDLLILYWCFA